MSYLGKNIKTVVHLIASNFFGGPEKQIFEHLRLLDKNKFQGGIITFIEKGGKNEILERASSAHTYSHGIPMSGPLDIRAQWALTTIIKKINVDLLCLHGYKACLMGWWAGRKLEIPLLAFSRGYTAENTKVAFYECLERRILKKVNGIVFVAEGQRYKLQTTFGIKVEKSWVVHNAISVNSFIDSQKTELRGAICKRLDIPIDCSMVISAGRLSPEKGHRYLIEAISKIEDRDKSIFVFCGEGPCKKDLEKRARELGIFHRCRFPGFRRDLNEIFQVMDLFVLPSMTEGLPNVILEAFACAKPVVATAVGGVPEIVEHDLCGFLVQPKRSDLLAEAIQKCLFSNELCRSLGEAGYQKVKKDFTFESQTKKLEQVYKEVLGA